MSIISVNSVGGQRSVIFFAACVLVADANDALSNERAPRMQGAFGGNGHLCMKHNYFLGGGVWQRVPEKKHQT